MRFKTRNLTGEIDIVDKRMGWKRFGVLMASVVFLLVIGWAPDASAGWKAERGSWTANWEETKAAREAAWEQWIESWQEALNEWEENRAANIENYNMKRGTDSATIGPDGGMLMVSYRGGLGGKDNVRVQFTVPRNALAADAEISMTLELDTEDLSDLTVVFAPAGLEFDIPAELKIRLGKEIAEDLGYQSIVGLHISEDPNSNGDLEEIVPLTIDPGRRKIDVYLEVNGFSRYSLGGSAP